jgi:hypothetical protein
MSENQTTVSFRTSSGSKKTGTTMNKTPQKISSSTIKVGVWELQSHEFTELAPPDDTESLFNLVPGSESVIGTDGRKPVPKKQIMPGGKYRGKGGIADQLRKQANVSSNRQIILAFRWPA